MKIAQVCPYDIGRRGGVQTQVISLSGSLSRRGHEAWIVAPGDAAGQPVRSLGRSRTWTVNDSAAPIKLSPTLVPRLRSAVADADVVHVHEPLMPLVSLAARWTGRPLVGTFHADPSQFVRRLYRRFPLLRRHLAAYRHLAAVSETARSAVSGLGDVGLVPNGVVTEGLPARAPVAGRVAFVGRDDPRKGLDLAVTALAEVRVRHPGAHLIVVTPDPVAGGPGIEMYRDVDDAVKAELLATTEVFVAPNRRGESFGLTVLEAMAAGTACVVSDLPAFSAVTGDAAVRFPAGSATELAGAIMDLLDDPERRDELARKGRERASRFSIEHTVDRYEEIYVSALRLGG